VSAHFGDGTMHTPVAHYTSCNYQDGQCTLVDGSALVWQPSEVQLSDNHELALTITFPYRKLVDCERPLVITDQGFAVEHYFHAVCENFKNLVNQLLFTVASSPTLAARRLLNISAIHARYSLANTLEIWPCASIANFSEEFASVHIDAAMDALQNKLIMDEITAWAAPANTTTVTYSFPTISLGSLAGTSGYGDGSEEVGQRRLHDIPEDENEACAPKRPRKEDDEDEDPFYDSTPAHVMMATMKAPTNAGTQNSLADALSRAAEDLPPAPPEMELKDVTEEYPACLLCEMRQRIVMRAHCMLIVQSDEGSTYTLVICEEQHCRSTTIAEALLNNVYFIYGGCTEIFSDNGRLFTSETYREF
ncbi:hypothetical protein AAVH_29617, partial [Aphelenchoides avenae]